MNDDILRREAERLHVVFVEVRITTAAGLFASQGFITCEVIASNPVLLEAEANRQARLVVERIRTTPGAL